MCIICDIPILPHARNKFEAVCETLKSKWNILQARLISAAVTSQGAILFSSQFYFSPASLAVGWDKLEVFKLVLTWSKCTSSSSSGISTVCSRTSQRKSPRGNYCKDSSTRSPPRSPWKAISRWWWWWLRWWCWIWWWWWPILPRWWWSKAKGLNDVIDGHSKDWFNRVIWNSRRPLQLETSWRTRVLNSFPWTPLGIIQNHRM